MPTSFYLARKAGLGREERTKVKARSDPGLRRGRHPAFAGAGEGEGAAQAHAQSASPDRPQASRPQASRPQASRPQASRPQASTPGSALTPAKSRPNTNPRGSERYTWRGRLAATEQARRTSFWRQRCSAGTKPTVRHLAALARKQASLLTRRSRENARRSRRRTGRRFARCSIRPCAKRQNPSSPCPDTSSLLLRVERLASLLWTGSQMPASVGIGRPTRNGCISRGRAPRAVLTEARANQRVTRVFAEIPTPAGIFKVSSADSAPPPPPGWR